MRNVIGVSLALICAGCGTWLLEGETSVRTTGRATLDVEVRGTRRIGRLEVVEQAPGQGFVVAGGAIASATLDGFGGSVAIDGSRSTAVTTDATTSAHAGDASLGANGAIDRSGDASFGANGGVDGSGARSGAIGSGDASYVAARSGESSGAIGSGDASFGARGGDAIAVAGSNDASVAEQGSGNATETVSRGSDASIDVTSGIDVEARATVARQGVWSREGRATAITALAGSGVQVDGVMVSLGELEALARIALPPAPSARLTTDGALEAWAELEHDSLPRAGGETHVVVRVRAPQIEQPRRERLRVHLVIDRSSSMQRDWARVLEAARILIRRLAPEDEIHIVAYGSDAMEAFAVARVGNGRAAIAALEAINVGGGTNIEAGLDLAYDVAARGGPRSLVILLSDGVPNRGAFEAGELGALAATARRRGCTTSVIGLGTEFDAGVLRTIARQGSGGYHVSASLDALGAGLVAELEAHARTMALGLSVRVELPSDVTLLGVAEGAAERVGDAVLLSVPHFDAGEERRIVLRIRVPAGSRARAVARVDLDYRSGLSDRPIAASRDLQLSYGARAVASGGASAIGVIDASLAAALDAAGTAIANGDRSAATSALEAHAALVEGRVEHRTSEPLQARARVVRRLARAVGELLPTSTHPQRRQAALSFGALAVRIAR